MKKIIGSFLFLITAGCANSNGTSTGNPLVALQFKSFTAFAMGQVGELNVSNLKMCFKRLRFKPVSGLAENIDLVLDEVSVVSTGTMITAANVPAGTYSRVEFDLDTHCASGKSVQVTNGTGSYASVDTMTIRFDGNLVLASAQNLDLNVQAIISALNNATSNGDIKIKAEFVGGSY